MFISFLKKLIVFFIIFRYINNKMNKKLIIEDVSGKLIELFPNSIKLIKPKIITEDLGKIFEMAICLLYNTPFNGKYKYSLTEAENLSNKISNLKNIIPNNLIHTAKNGSRYDFTLTDGDGDAYLSAKTTKKGDKVCPQVIGQPSKKKFCSHFGLDNSLTTNDIKKYIQTNVLTMLDKYFEYTFDCPIIYYNQQQNICLLIKKREEINWTKYPLAFSHILKGKEWNESSSISINGITLGEFQVHNHRDNIKFRWNLLNLIKMFESNFEVIKIMNE
jgi:hypothetical protein